MASAGQKWETVGKPNKKNKQNNAQLTKQQRKAFRDSMPKIENAPPVKESTTIYDAFLEKEDKPKKPTKEQTKPMSNGDATKKTGQSKKKQGKEKQKLPLCLDEALQRLEVAEFETVLAKDMETFPENPSVWLKDLASMLNVRLESAVEPDPCFEGQPRDYPMCALPKSVHQLIRKTLSQCSNHVLELFLEHCIQALLNDIAKGAPTCGYRTFIQLLALDKPDLFLSGLDKYLEMLRQNQNRVLRCLAILWAVGQAGNRNLGNGLRVWLEVMLPMINVRVLSKYSVEYLEGLFKTHESNKSAYGVLNFRNFSPLLDLILSSHSHLLLLLQKKLLALYPKLRAIAFGKTPENNLRNFFPLFLERLTPTCNKNLKKELLSSLVECLVVDKHCYSVWRQMYTKTLDQSGILLRHLVQDWDSVQKQLERKLLLETIRAFSITNEELSSQGKSGGEGYKACVMASKELLVKMTPMGWPLKFLLLLVFTVFSGVIIYDAYVSKGFKSSRTARLLQDAGLLNFVDQVATRIRVYSALAMAWLQENVPYYYAKACDFLGPYLQLLLEKLHDGGLYLLEVTKPHREWLAEKIPELLAWVQSKLPGLLETPTHYALLAWEYAVAASMWLWTHAVHYSHLAGTWLQENVFTGSLSGENIQKTLLSLLTTAQAYSSALVQWASQLVSSKGD